MDREPDFIAVAKPSKLQTAALWIIVIYFSGSILMQIASAVLGSPPDIIHTKNPVLTTTKDMEWPTGMYVRVGDQMRFYMLCVPEGEGE